MQVGGGRPGGEAVGPDRLPALGAPAVAARRHPAQGRVDLGQLLPGLAEQGGGVLPLERDRRALRVVLVVGAGRAGRLDDPGQLPLQPVQPRERVRPFGRQPLLRPLLLGHPSWVPGSAGGWTRGSGTRPRVADGHDGRAGAAVAPPDRGRHRARRGHRLDDPADAGRDGRVAGGRVRQHRRGRRSAVHRVAGRPLVAMGVAPRSGPLLPAPGRAGQDHGRSPGRGAGSASS